MTVDENNEVSDPKQGGIGTDPQNMWMKKGIGKC
jgi:hypothetical protein